MTDKRTAGPWVKFTADFIFTPDEDRRTSVKYRAGWSGRVRQQCADKAAALGRIEPSKPRGRKSAA